MKTKERGMQFGQIWNTNTTTAVLILSDAQKIGKKYFVNYVPVSFLLTVEKRIGEYDMILRPKPKTGITTNVSYVGPFVAHFGHLNCTLTSSLTRKIYQITNNKVLDQLEAMWKFAALPRYLLKSKRLIKAFQGIEKGPINGIEKSERGFYYNTVDQKRRLLEYEFQSYFEKVYPQ